MELKNKIKRVAIYLRKSRNKEGEETEETLAKHRKRLLDIAHKNNWQFESPVKSKLIGLNKKEVNFITIHFSFFTYPSLLKYKRIINCFKSLKSGEEKLVSNFYNPYKSTDCNKNKTP
ncbi:hypothetical protein P9738_04340 [Bacillus siamensis]|uniref:hypothetical protein n=1 Tax=Bacillus siamensis TaxID=659243 RepID=UPI0022B7D10E|nr:hypothetical protein [Bacillus siamensis]MDU0812589.1 hypothetical protein [Bacillus siamensis]MED5046678.1 hypothetical protein [Bacillus siamensis]MED5095537.1 hypothetical protein [Bacillus siamensis]